jgi:hypothetical protein
MFQSTFLLLTEVGIRQFEMEQPYYKRDGNAYTITLVIMLYILNV